MNQERINALNARAEQILSLDFLQFQVTIDSILALVWAKKAQGYNGHTTENLVNIVEGCNKLVPPMMFGEGNPNNGHPHHHFSVGNEYSRVIYLEVIKTYLPASFDYDKLTEKLEKLAQKNNADEFSVEENSETAYKFRFWFD